MAKFAKIIKENTEKHLIKKFITLFKSKITKKVKNDGRFSFVLTGGDSPINLYKVLSKTKKIPWKKVDFFIGDERYVSEKSKYSNIKMCKKYLLDKINISEKQIFNISTKSKSIKNETISYEKKIKNYFLNKKISFDLVLLGIGNDGHIASLFKNNINKKNKRIVDYVRKKDFFRITITIKSINNSKNIFLWAPTKKKILIIKKILSDNKFNYPASFLKKKNNILFYCN